MGAYEHMVMDTILYSSLSHLLATGEIFVPVKAAIIRIIPARWSRIEEGAATLLYCSQCLGFWVGLAGSVTVSGLTNHLPAGLANVLFAATVSSFALLLTRFTEKRSD